VLVVALGACGGGSAGAPPQEGVVIETAVPGRTPPVEEVAAPTATPVPVQSGRVTLNAVGDLMLERDIIDLMDEYGALYPFERVLHLLNDADITIANMEGTFTERGVRANKFYAFRTPPRFAVGLAQAGIDVVSLGNNHTMDYGETGLRDTLAALDEAGILHSGAGLNSNEARQPVFVEKNGLTLAFLSYASVLTEAHPAGPASPGVAAAEEAAIRQDVAAASREADLVIVSLHAGFEYRDAPNDQQRQLSRAAIEAGAALVLGHHAHVLQGWTQYRGGVIVYGLGNFVFDLDYYDLEELGPRPFQTLVLHLELSKDGVEAVTARPVFIDPDENRPVPATGERLAAIEARIRQLNAALE
jgi:poly-gamma-glutamate capsule biosynthesis protein CapA/YwtB (metallophosphatase superfamily)